jgi:hypothetical protein
MMRLADLILLICSCCLVGLDGKPFDVWGIRTASASPSQERTDHVIAQLDEYRFLPQGVFPDAVKQAYLSEADAAARQEGFVYPLPQHALVPAFRGGGQNLLRPGRPRHGRGPRHPAVLRVREGEKRCRIFHGASINLVLESGTSTDSTVRTQEAYL